MVFFSELRHELNRYLEKSQVEQIHHAYLFGREAHEGQTRQTGEPYITHPLSVALILAKMRMDPQTIMAAILHDTIEDTKIDKPTISKEFGQEVANLVDGVTKLTKIQFENKAEAQAESFRKMILAMVRDIRVILIKLADRLHNMQTLQTLRPDKRRRIARETLDIYSPIANRLGMHSMRLELEDLGFSALFPMRYRILQNAVKKARGHRAEIVARIENAINEQLAKLAIKGVSVKGRHKHLYSIYRKMRNKHLPLAEIMDVYGFRIIVDSVDSCYRALGAVHGLYKPLPERFKDYISIPKANGYQSLHTTLFGPYGVPIEIQIRTQEMDYMAESGVAAHWLYKNNETIANESQLRAREWFKKLLEMQRNTGNSLEFIENVKIDLFPDEVYVFTPQGDILELPRGATAVDFAYAIHSDIGNACVAAKVERRLVPLSMPLSNGQTVEILRTPEGKPNPAWLNFVVTGKARSNIKHFIKNQRRHEAIEFGKHLLYGVLPIQLQVTINDRELLKKIAKSHKLKSADDLLEAIGLGNIPAIEVGQRLMADKQVVTPNHLPVDRSIEPLLIKSAEGMMLHFAECCYPIPGDKVVGYLTAGQGIEVHRIFCSKLRKLRQATEKFIPIKWDDKVQGEFKVDTKIQVANQRGVLAVLAKAIADAGANIDDVSVVGRDGGYNLVRLTLGVRDRGHLARLMRKVRNISSVTRLTRVTGGKS